MSSTHGFIAYVQDLMRSEGVTVVARKMFGEYALYLDGKVVAFVCDDQVFVKPLPATEALTVGMTPAPPYPGAKDYWRADAELDEPERLAHLLRATAAALPVPMPRLRAARGKGKAKPRDRAPGAPPRT